jgi:hypothetical protein
MKMQQIPLKAFRAHKAQMRTQYDLDELAALTLQVYERGLDAWSPIVAAAHGDEYHIISGHRRHKAALLALALKGWVNDNPDREITIEVVRTMFQTLVESLGSLDKLMASLVTRYGGEFIDFVPFEGSEKSQILTLQAANYGSAKADALGIAHSFREAVLAGASEAEIARNSGQHPNYVRNHLALTEIHPELSRRIAAGELPMSVAATLADLPEPKRTGLAIFILANDVGKITAATIKDIATTLKKWPGLQQPLFVKHQTQRNVIRALLLLWNAAVAHYPQDAYATVALFVYRGLEKDPWTNDAGLLAWFEAFGGETYVTEGQINWKAVEENLLPSISCQTCPLAQLPKERLQVDVPDLPCRAGQVVERCLNGLAPDDPFEVRVSWDWAGLPGIMHEGRDYKARSLADLLQAWQAQAEREQEEEEVTSHEPFAVGGEGAVGDEPLAAGQKEATSREPRSGGNKTTTATPSLPAANSQPPAADVDSPVAKQRALIADYMARHEQFAVPHPLATPCATCRHRLEQSPTKDETVPHCTWAGRPRQVTFKLLQAESAAAPVIPVCKQYAPTGSWADLIPEHAQPPQMPRDWLKEQILLLSAAATSNWDGGFVPFEFLTGRPLSKSEKHGDWFAQQLNEQIGDLSLGQMWTLFIWAMSEWQRAKGQKFTLALNGSGIQFATYQELGWKKG